MSLTTDAEKLRAGLATALARDLRQLGLPAAPEFVESQQARIVQLTQELSLAEEGLANYAQETQELKRALNFWLPMIPEDAPLDENACLSRIEQDARLLFKYDGESDEQCAAELGWISLHPPQKVPHTDT